MKCKKLRLFQGLRGLNSSIGPLERMDVMLLISSLKGFVQICLFEGSHGDKLFSLVTKPDLNTICHR